MNTFNCRPAAWAWIGLAGLVCTPAQALNFSAVTGGPESASVTRIDSNGNGTLYVSSGSQVFSSSDSGTTWTPTSSSLITGLRGVVADGSNVFIATGQGIQKSSDGGSTFTDFNGSGAGVLPNIDRLSSTTFEVADGFVYAASQDPDQGFETSVYRSPVASANWTDVSPSGLTSFGNIISAGSNLCLLARNNGVQVSSDNGDTWTRATNTNGNFSFIGKSPDASDVYVSGGGLRRSTDQCASFTQADGNGLVPTGGFSNDVFSLGVDAVGNVYAGGNLGTLRVSTDNGNNFTIDNSGELTDNTGISIRALTGSGSAMVLGTSGDGIFTNGSGPWMRATGPASSSVGALANGGGAGVLDIGVLGGGYFRTSDGGTTITRGGETALRRVRALYRDGTTLIVGTEPLRSNGLSVTGLFRSTDGGTSFSSVSGFPDGAGINSIVSDGTAIYASVNSAAAFADRGVFKSTDGGATWSNTSNNLPGTNGVSIRNMAARGTSIFAYVAQNGVYLSTDGGATWTEQNTGLSGSFFGKIFATPNALVTSVGGVVYRSADNAASWQATTGYAISQFGIELLSMAEDAAGVVYLGDEHAGLSVSTDGAATWTPDSDGLPGSSICIGRIEALLVNNGRLYAGNGAGDGLIVSDVLGNVTPGDSVDCTTAGGASSDNTPDAFAFTDQVDVAQDTLITSDTVTISGIDDGTDISIDLGEYSIGCMTAGFTATAGTIDDGQSVCVRHTSANSPNTAINSVLTVGTGSDTFTSTTAQAAAPDTTPDMFAFTDITDVTTTTRIQSDTITVMGIDTPAPIAVADGSYSIGCGASGSFTTSDGTVNNGDTVCVSHTSATAASTSVNTTLTIGGVSDNFTSTTRADGASDVQTVNNPNGQAVQVTSSAGNIANLANDPNPPAGITPPAMVTFANGFFSFDITGLGNGDSVDVTLTLPSGSTPDTYYKFQNGGSFEFLRGATDNEGAVINGNVITLTLIDGGLGDADGMANGSISDPGAPGTTASSGGDGSDDLPFNITNGGGGCVLAPESRPFDPLFLLLALASLMWLAQRKRGDIH